MSVCVLSSGPFSVYDSVLLAVCVTICLPDLYLFAFSVHFVLPTRKPNFCSSFGGFFMAAAFSLNNIAKIGKIACNSQV